MTKKKDIVFGYQMALSAMFDVYSESKKSNPSNPKTTFTTNEIVTAVQKKYGGEIWDAKKISNVIQNLKRKGLADSVGQAKEGKRTGPLANLWCSMEILAAETEPDEKPEPEPEPVVNAALVRVQAFTPVKYESEPAVESTDEEVEEIEIVTPVIPAQQTKRKKSTPEPLPPESNRDTMRTLHEISKQLGDVVIQLEQVRKEQRTIVGTFGRIKSDIELTKEDCKVILYWMKEFDKQVAAMMREFVGKLSNEAETYKSAFVNGWNSHYKAQQAVVNEKGGTIEKINEEKVSFDPETRSVIVDGGQSGRVGNELFVIGEPRAAEAKKVLDAIKGWDDEVLAIATNVATNPDRTRAREEYAEKLRAEVDKAICENHHSRHASGSINSLPRWAKKIWSHYMDDFKRTLAVEDEKTVGLMSKTFKEVIRNVEVWELPQTSGGTSLAKVQILAKSSITGKNESFDFLIMGNGRIQDGRMVVIPYRTAAFGPFAF